MFKGSLVKHLEKEVEWLRQRNEELENKLMALTSSGALAEFQYQKDLNQPKEQQLPVQDQLARAVNSMEAETDEQKRDKALTEKQLESMFTGSTPVMSYSR